MFGYAPQLIERDIENSFREIPSCANEGDIDFKVTIAGKIDFTAPSGDASGLMISPVPGEIVEIIVSAQDGCLFG